MAQVLTTMEALRRDVQELYDEMEEDKKPGAKELQRYLVRKDALIGGGQHHRNRIVSRGQIMGDLQRWLDDPNHH